MRGMWRLIDGLLRGDTEAAYVLVFAVVGTLAILFIVGAVRRSRA